MKIIGLTGGIATGKSTVSSLLQQVGIPVIDCDVLARGVVEKVTWGYRRLTAVLRGHADVLTTDGELDRDRVA